MSDYPTAQIREAVAAAVLAAWTPQSIDYGKPKTEPRPLDYAVIKTEKPDPQIETAISIQVTQVFRVIGRFAYPSDDTDLIEDEKEAKKNLLRAQLITGPTFSDFCYLPQLFDGDDEELDDIPERAYEVVLDFSVLYRVQRV